MKIKAEATIVYKSNGVQPTLKSVNVKARSTSSIVKREEVVEDTRNTLYGQQEEDLAPEAIEKVNLKVEDLGDVKDGLHLIANGPSNEPTTEPAEEEVIYDEKKRYCGTCDITYSSRAYLRTHLSKIHKLVLPSSSKEILHPQLLPDINNSDHYCCACERTFPNREKFRQHLIYAHNIRVSQLAILHPDVTPDINDTNFFCKACEKKFPKKKSYIVHLECVHKLLVPHPRQIKHPHLVPDIDDPNNWCSACEKSFKRKYAYDGHLVLVHRITIPTRFDQRRFVVDPNNQPDPNDPNDPNFYCKPCKRKYVSKFTYQIHIARTHRTLDRGPVRNCRLNAHVVPDANDPNNYCSSCETKYINSKSYRGHLKKIHKMTLPDRRKISIVHPDLTPDINDANSYCCACGRTFNSRAYFLEHLANIYNIRPLTDNHSAQSDTGFL